MRIRKFYEAEDMENPDISNDRVNEIIDDISSIISKLSKDSTQIKSISSELSGYSSKSKKSNDQIDDCIVNVQILEKRISESISYGQRVIDSLNSYVKDGRKFLY